MTLRETALVAGMVATLIPTAAAYLRHRSGANLAITALTAVVQALFLATVWRLVAVGPYPGVRFWVYALVGMTVPVLLTGYLFTAVLGRESVGASIRSVSRTFAGLFGVGVLALLLLDFEGFILGYQWKAGSGTILLGPIGKAFLSYLLVGVVFVGYNLESTYRLAGGPARSRLRPVVLGLFGVLGFYTYLLTTGLLYSAIELDGVIASVGPLVVASVLTAYGFLKGSLTDTAVPVSRNVVYSSFTAFAAALYVLAMGMAAQMASFTKWSPGQVVTVAFVLLVVLVSVVLVFSNRVQRRVRRFIDRNFYVNRYDYRAQWFRVTRTLSPAQGPEGVLEAADSLLREVFSADGVTIALKDRSGRGCRVWRGEGADEPELLLLEDSPLCRKLKEERRALLLPRQADDLEYVSIYVENAEWLDATASQVVAPLLAGQEILGVVGLARSHPDDRFSYEDLDLLDCIAAEVAAVLRAVNLARELAESRETELFSQWSNMILHDLKNYLSPLRLLVQNMKVHMGDPQFQKEAVEDLAAVTARMQGMVEKLSGLRRTGDLVEGFVAMNDLVSAVVAELQLHQRPSLQVRMDLAADVGVRGDAGMLRRVVENLITNAVEAMGGKGLLSVQTRSERTDGNGEVGFVLVVSDTGPGMDESFLRERLFRPFATTKKKGLGLGLYQCRAVVEAHGGEIQVESRPGEGTTFWVSLRGAVPESVGSVQKRQDEGPGRGERA